MTTTKAQITNANNIMYTRVYANINVKSSAKARQQSIPANAV